jgi:hypothetical protein
MVFFHQNGLTVGAQQAARVGPVSTASPVSTGSTASTVSTVRSATSGGVLIAAADTDFQSGAAAVAVDDDVAALVTVKFPTPFPTTGPVAPVYYFDASSSVYYCGASIFFHPKHLLMPTLYHQLQLTTWALCHKV